MVCYRSGPALNTSLLSVGARCAWSSPPPARDHPASSPCFISADPLFPSNSYGFVTFSSEADAIQAVSQLDKSELAGRQINVELAKPPTATAAGRIPKAAAKAAVQQGATEGEQVTEGEAKPKKSKSKKVRFAFYPRLCWTKLTRR